MLFAGVSLAALFTGCMNSGGDYTNPYDPIMPGVRIYNSAWTQTTLALDPVGVAIRLEMLLAEAQDTGKGIDELTGEYDGGMYRLKSQLLFGSGTSIVSAGNGVYEITYVGSELPRLDNFQRKGTYIVDTKGVRLSDSSQAEPWTVTIGGNGRMDCWTMVEQGSRIEYTIVDAGTVSISKNDAGPFYGIVVEHFKSYVMHESEFTSDWGGKFEWMPEIKQDGEKADERPMVSPLSYLNLTNATFQLYGSAVGEVGSSFNGTTATHMSYNVPVTAPLKWSPANTMPYNLVIGGTESAAITSYSDYDKNEFPSPMVTVRRSVKDGMYRTQVTYNGTSMYL